MANEERTVECKFVRHIPSRGNLPDIHLVKELITEPGKEPVRRLRIIKDFKRPFWVVKEHFRTYTQKREYEHIDKLQKYTCTQSDLSKTVARVLNLRDTGMRRLANSPFLYGTDISSSAIIKKLYQTKYPDLFTPFTVATLDFETNIADGTITIGSIAFQDQIVTAARKDFIPKDVKDPEVRIKELFQELVPSEKARKNTKIFFSVENTEVDILKALFNKALEWAPDWMAIWNIAFDVPVMRAACERAGVQLSSIVAGSDMPAWVKHFSFKESPAFRKKDNGDTIPIAAQDRWHLTSSASPWYWVDAMCDYAFVRVGQGKVPTGYGLDSILHKEIKQRKIKFPPADKYKKAAWHNFMTKNYFMQYIVYNQWDCISMLELDDETQDLKVTTPVLSGHSSFDIFNSQPKRGVEDLHYATLEEGYVMGSSPGNHCELFDKTLGKSNWIVTLASYLITNRGLKILNDVKGVATNFFAHVFDSDAVSSYPSDMLAAKVSSMATLAELVDIKGVDKETFKIQNINLISSDNNSVEYCVTMFGFPDIQELEKAIE